MPCSDGLSQTDAEREKIKPSMRADDRVGVSTRLLPTLILVINLLMIVVASKFSFSL